MTDMRSEAINEFTAALAKAQGAMHNAVMNRVNPHFKSKYADLAAIIDAVKEALSANGLAPTHQIIITDDGAMRLLTTLAHTSGQWRASLYPLPSGAKPQEFGSALTYARRYSLSSLVGIASEEDDDANAAQARHTNGKTALNGGDKITPDQVKKLTELLEAKGRTVEQFCQWREIAKVEDLPAARFDSTKAYLIQMGGAK